MTRDFFNRLVGLFLLGGMLSSFDCAAQSGIEGRILPDTAQWAPIAYLSIIPDFNQMYVISNELIIQKSEIGADGTFRFDTKKMGREDHLYRIHFAKKGEPPASLIIGGRDENHLFLVANNGSEIAISIEGRKQLLGRVTYSGYKPNLALQEINQIAGFLDTLDMYGPTVNRDFVREAVYERLRRYADTCSVPLISLYAMYQSRFESDYLNYLAFYEKYLRKWRHEDSEYFKAFRAQLPVKESPNIIWPWLIAAFVIMVIALAITLYIRKRRSVKSPYQSLTVQERKIFSLLKAGKSNKEISETCGVSLSTVKSHVNNIYSKLNLSSRTDVMDFEE
ncbi:MAG: LuxR C-terminal-related transcriptional regulator [Bacteroidota bacterium]